MKLRSKLIPLGVALGAGLTVSVNAVGAAPNVSINSTSQNSLDVGVDPYAVGPVPQRPRPNNANSLSPAAGTGTTGYQVLAINDWDALRRSGHPHLEHPAALPGPPSPRSSARGKSLRSWDPARSRWPIPLPPTPAIPS
jgi:hypothetical protein